MYGSGGDGAAGDATPFPVSPVAARPQKEVESDSVNVRMFGKR